MLLAQRGVTEGNIFLRYEQQFGKSFDIWCISSLAAETTAGLLSKVNKIYETDSMYRDVSHSPFPFFIHAFCSNIYRYIGGHISITVQQ